MPAQIKIDLSAEEKQSFHCVFSTEFGAGNLSGLLSSLLIFDDGIKVSIRTKFLIESDGVI